MLNGDKGLKLNSKYSLACKISKDLGLLCSGYCMQFSMLFLSLVSTELSFCNFWQKVQEMCDTGVVFFIAG